MPLILKNPHSVMAALQQRPYDVKEVRFVSDQSSGSAVWRDVAALARENNVPVVTGGGSRAGGGRRSSKQRGQKSERPGIAEAQIVECSEQSLEEIFSSVQPIDGGGDSFSEQGQKKSHGLWLAFDQIQDPHNAGAIFRSAAFFGVRGIILTKDRSAPINSTVYDVACGGVETVPFTQQSNLSRTLQIAKDAGLWILGTSEHADQNAADIPLDRPWLLVLGNEEKGLRRLTKEQCDMTCALKPAGIVTSLNVSVAAGIMIARLSGNLDS